METVRVVIAEDEAMTRELLARLIGAEADDTVVTTAFGEGWPDAPHRVLRSALAAGEALGAAQSWGPDWPSATSTGAVEARALYAGQSVGAVRARTTAAGIVNELVDEADRLLSTSTMSESRKGRHDGK